MNCVEREQYYIDLFDPEYNILKTAGSSLGFKHTDEAIDKMRTKGIGRSISQETKNKISDKMMGNTNAANGIGQERADPEIRRSSF